MNFCHAGHCEEKHYCDQHGTDKNTFCGCGGNFSLQPFVYGLKQEEDPVTWRKYYVEDTTQKYPLRFFYHGDPYKLLGFIPGDIHFFGTPQPDVFFPSVRIFREEICIPGCSAHFGFP